MNHKKHVSVVMKLFMVACPLYFWNFLLLRSSSALILSSSFPCQQRQSTSFIKSFHRNGHFENKSSRFVTSSFYNRQQQVILGSTHDKNNNSVIISKRRRRRTHLHSTRPDIYPGTNTLSSSFQNNKNRITIQYSPSSIQHLAAVELPPVYSRPWTLEKIKAISGAFLTGIATFFIGSYTCTSILQFHDDQPAILAGGFGLAMGWYLFGGGEVMEKERDVTDRNGGYDAKLVADRPKRLETVMEDLLQSEQWRGNVQITNRNVDHVEAVGARDDAMKYISKVHGQQEYLTLLKTKCQETNRPIRLNPLYARTLIDQNSYLAAISAVQDWLDSVDVALSGGTSSTTKPLFALTRPPGHHACKSKGMGGCLLNNAAIAAFYALDQEGVRNVAILDIDAHHGNGIAHCVQEEERIRYCSIHEEKNGGKLGIERRGGGGGSEDEKDNPRTQDGEDVGPIGNLLNINLTSGTGWDNGYKDALVGQALPFLLMNKPDLIIISAGFDALETDWSSGLMLQPKDYRKLGGEIRRCFGNTVAMGLEGGYSFQNHALSEAIMEFCSTWDDDDIDDDLESFG
mmetsp:Transcript_4295/g.8224  ORF Transcript_4295/g.8224 Transcript_4295/m.8224 type:complete len:571 (+) Transcript_4295:125-1837(+)